MSVINQLSISSTKSKMADKGTLPARCHFPSEQYPGPLFIPGRVIFLFQLVKVDGNLVPQRNELFVAFVLQRSQLLISLVDGLVHRGEIVQNEVLLEIGDQPHKRFTCAHLWDKKWMVGLPTRFQMHWWLGISSSIFRSKCEHIRQLTKTWSLYEPTICCLHIDLIWPY